MNRMKIARLVCVGMVWLCGISSVPAGTGRARLEALLRQLDAPVQAKSDEARQELMKLAERDPEARKFLSENLPPMLERKAPNQYGIGMHMWENGFYIAGKLRIVEAIPVLLDHVTTRTNPVGGLGWEWEFRDHAAVGALVEMGPPAVPSVIQTLRHGNPFERRAAAYILARIGTQQAKDALREALTTESDPKVRKRIEQELQRLH